MIDTPQITETQAQSTAVIPLQIPKAEIRSVMGPGIQELMATVTAQGLSPAGPWFTRHFRIAPEHWDFEIGVPVSAPVIAQGRVQPSELPAAKVVRTIYHGPYEGLSSAWGDFDGWIKANGLEVGESIWEVYLIGPESGGDPSTWQTQLNRPLIGE